MRIEDEKNRVVSKLVRNENETFEQKTKGQTKDRAEEIRKKKIVENFTIV